MFSEYASRFLQQSNARLSFAPDQDQSQNPLDRRRNPSTNSRYAQRPGMNDQPSGSRFPFASRLSRNDPQAPLFFSTTEDAREEDDDQEIVHEREVADFYALQRSRQQFGPSNLTESSELEDESMEQEEGQNHDREEEDSQRGRMPPPRLQGYRSGSTPGSEQSGPSARLVDVNLASTINEEPPASLANLASMTNTNDRPTPFQEFRQFGGNKNQRSTFLPAETDEDTRRAMPRPPSADRESIPPTVILPALEPPKHDAFWANLFQIGLFAMFASFVLIWFHTSTPAKKTPLGDTVYSAIRSSTNMLLWDTMIAIIVALIWLSLLRNYVRPLVYTIIIAVPVVLFAFSLYPLIASFHGRYNGSSVQDRAMRWLSFVPAVMGIVFTWSVIRTRHSLARSISILEFTTKILAASPYLIFLGFATLGVVVVWTWVWMLMFERVFLAGHLSGAKKFLLDANSWWLAAFFVLQYLWTLGVIAGIQRATTAAAVSQWYFHRLAVPQPTSSQVVRASFAHATGALFGTISLSTFLALLVRLPLVILPGRLAGLLNLCAFWIVPTRLATLTNPLTLTYAAVHSQPLGVASRGLSQLHFVSPIHPSNTLHPRHFKPTGAASGVESALIPYRLAKLILQATRWLVSLGLGVSGWVRTAHSMRITSSEGAPPGAGVKGSLYAYIVALIAGTIGFAVLGAVENVVGAALDAAVVCWASETGGAGRGEARFCREAGELFGEEGRYGYGADEDEEGGRY